MKRFWTLRCCIALFAVMILVHSAAAIGFWLQGEVNEAPWYDDDIRYMVVNEVKYTIMDETVVQEVISNKDAVYKSGMAIEDIRQGDEVLIQAEGNRIYQIEILR